MPTEECSKLCASKHAECTISVCRASSVLVCWRNICMTPRHMLSFTPPPVTPGPCLGPYKLWRVLSQLGQILCLERERGFCLNGGWECECLNDLGAWKHDRLSVITFIIIITFKPKTNSNCGEETSERQIFCSVWRKTSEPTSWDGYWCRSYQTRMVSSVRLHEDCFLLYQLQHIYSFFSFW